MSRLRDSALLRRALTARTGSPAAPKAAPAPADYARELSPALLSREANLVTRLLYDRLGEEQAQEVERRAAGDPELPAINPADAAGRRGQVLSYGMWLGMEAIPERTGLHTAQPPDEVHAMARGPLSAAGGLYEADMVTDALASAGVAAGGLQRALDFGCSSGRVVRVLQAAYPEVGWIGCDPNEQAIAWAREHLAPIEFFTSLQAPPLGIEYGSLDLVYAISIWSHFAPKLGLRWFDEMHRLIRPGGHLVATTHGLQSVARYAGTGMRSPREAEEILAALYRQGWWYASEFGDQGDWGVVNSSWGTAFLSAEWLLTKLTPEWRVVEFAPGRNQGNQDVYVLERV